MCESRGGYPGLPVPNSPYGLCGRKATLHERTLLIDILGTNCDQCPSTVQCCFTSTETVRLIRTKSPGRPPRLSHSSRALPLAHWRAQSLNTLPCGDHAQSSGAESRWPSWAFRPNDSYGFCRRKATLNHASALAAVCP